MANRCFLCGRPMIKKDGLLYELCTNPKCVRSKPLPTPKEELKDDTKEEAEK